MNERTENKILTVGILTFNRSNMLDELLRSLLSNTSETLSKIEILVLDNGSTDQTSKIIETYSNKLEIKKLREDINLRGSIRFKELIELSKGKFIILPGDDDIFIEGIFDQVIPFLENVTNDVTIIAAAAEVIDQNKDQLRINYQPTIFEIKSHEIAELFEKSIYWLPATFIRTSEIVKLNSPNSLIAFDWYLWILAATKGKTISIPQKIIKYRQHLEKEQNSFLQNNWDMDELIMFMFAIQQGAIHNWLISTSDSELQLFMAHLNKITKDNKPRTISTLKYILLIQEITKYSKFQKLLNESKINKLNSIDPRFLQVILGYQLKWLAFKDIFEEIGLAFEIDTNELKLEDGVYVHKIENKFLLRIQSQGKLIYEGTLEENELLYRISDHYNRVMREIRSSQMSNQITKFEWLAIKIIRRIKKLRYGKTIKIRRNKP